ncbi:MAG: hypothetical protein B7X00_00845, partial [Legionella sp. 21-45-4]
MPHLTALVNHLSLQTHPSTTDVIITGHALKHLDSAGALTLLEYKQQLEQQHRQVTLIDFSDQHTQLIHLVAAQYPKLEPRAEAPVKSAFLETLGKQTVNKIYQINGFLQLLGDLCEQLFHAMYDWRRVRFPSMVHHLYTTGIQALPILGLLSFLIGVVLAYQMGVQLETYG